MGLSKCKLGDLIEPVDLRNMDLSLSDNSVKGISITKKLIPTKADLGGVSLKLYKLLKPESFAYAPVTSRNSNKISIAYNDTHKTYLVSSSYIVLKIIKTKLLNPHFLYMYFNRPEFDRIARFNSWGSAREVFSWNDICDIEIEIPTMSTQLKYVEIYNTMQANQASYKKGLNDLKLTCDVYIEKLLEGSPLSKIGNNIFLLQQNNSDLGLSKESVRGISNQKEFIPTKANLDGVSLKPYLIVPPEFFSYVSVTSRNGDKISIAYNNTEHTYLVSSSYICFGVNKEVLNPDYLAMFFNKDEFNRYARFHSWGSAREVFSWDDLCEVKIPIPDIGIQEAIVNIYKVYNKRKEISESLKKQMKDICPILIKGALQEQD